MRQTWQELDEATNERDGKRRLRALVDQLDKSGYTAAARCLADDLDALVVRLRHPTRCRRRWRSTDLLEHKGALRPGTRSLHLGVRRPHTLKGIEGEVEVFRGELDPVA